MPLGPQPPSFSTRREKTLRHSGGAEHLSLRKESRRAPTSSVPYAAGRPTLLPLLAAVHKGGGVRVGGGGCGWHRAQQRGTHHLECTPDTPTGWAAYPGPARATGLSPTRARLLCPSGHPRTQMLWAQEGLDGLLACLVFPSLLNEFQDVITIVGDVLERTGALKATRRPSSGDRWQKEVD